MISEKMQAAINKQINAEAYSAYLYLSMGAYFDSLNLDGFSNWMKVQAREETDHARRFYDFLIERGGRVALQSIEGPPTEWKSAQAAFEAAYEHECKVTGMINDLVALAREQNDNPSLTLLQWFITEQVEEEASTERIARELKLVGDNGQGLLMLDRELAQRVYTPAPTTQNQQA